MTTASFTRLESKVIPLPRQNIDTDQIIPARYLKAIDKASVAQGLFADWRYNADGSPKADFVLNMPQFKDAHILLAGDNFGCGSSREHAPWALTGSGIRVVISTSFADIFHQNALKNGLLPITVEGKMHQTLFDLCEEVPGAVLVVDLEAETVTLPDGSSFSFKIDPFARACLLKGVDQLGYILSYNDKITAYEEIICAI